MINKLISWLIPEPKTNLQIVVDKINAQEEVRSATIRMSMDGKVPKINIVKDLHFLVGKVSYSIGYTFKYFLVQFSTGDKECIVKLKDHNEPLFVFNDPGEIREIRQTIISKYEKMIEVKKAEREADFNEL